MTKSQRIIWAFSLTTLTLVATFKPTPIGASAIDSVRDFDELIDYLFDPNSDAVSDEIYNSSKGLEIFSLPATLWLLSIQNPDSQSVSLSNSSNYSGYISVQNKRYPGVASVSDFSIGYGDSKTVFSSPIYSLAIANNYSSLPATLFSSVETDSSGNRLLFTFTQSGSPLISLSYQTIWEGSPSQIGSYSASFMALYSVPTNHNIVRGFWSSSSLTYAVFGLAGVTDLSDYTQEFNPADLSSDWVNIYYPELKSKYPDVDTYLPVINTADLPDYENWIYPPDFPIPDVPEIELPTNDIPTSALNGVSFWFTQFTNLIEGLDCLWFVILAVAVAFLFHFVLKY